jgi:hypothetical protein
MLLAAFEPGQRGGLVDPAVLAIGPELAATPEAGSPTATRP